MRKSQRVLLLLVVLVILAGLVIAVWWKVRSQPGISLYVSPQGEGDQCSYFSPCSLADAQEKVRGLVPTMTGDIIVYLRGGEYFLENELSMPEKSLVFGAADSGTAEHAVVYKAYKKEKPRLSAGRLITGWKLAENGVYQTQVNGLTFRQLYVNDRRAVRARTPNLEDESNFGPYLRLTRWEGGDKVLVPADQISPWKDLAGVEMVIKKYWNQSRLRIDQVETSEVLFRNGDVAVVSFMQPESQIESEIQWPPKGANQTYYLENSIEFLDAPGEWYLDDQTGILSYLPLPGEDMTTAQVIAPAIEQVVVFNGAHDIRFEGITFEHTTWLMPDDHRVGNQAGTQAWVWSFIPGGIRLMESHHIEFKGCIFQHMGGMGVEFVHSTHDNLILDSTFRDIASNGITVCSSNEPNPPEARICQSEVIRGNTITRVAQEYTGGVGIAVIYARGVVIEKNKVSDLPYTGISVGWGWTSESTVLQDNLVQENEIFRVMQLHDDGAGIYTLSRQPGTRLVKNKIHDIRPSTWAARGSPIAGIYLDEGTTEVVVELNTIENVEEQYNFHLIGENTIITINKDGKKVEFTVP